MKRRKSKKRRKPKAPVGPFDTSLGATRLAWRPEDAGARFSVTHTGKTEPVPVPPTSHPPQYEEMLSRIEVLEALMAELPNQRRRTNDPPITDDDISEITKAVAILKAQPGTETPKRPRRQKRETAKAATLEEVVPTLEVVPKKAKAAGSTLRKIGERLGTYLDTFLLEASKSGGKEAGKEGVKLLLRRLPYWLALYFALTNIANYVASIFLK